MGFKGKIVEIQAAAGAQRDQRVVLEHDARASGRIRGHGVADEERVADLGVDLTAAPNNGRLAFEGLDDPGHRLPGLGRSDTQQEGHDEEECHSHEKYLVIE
ncbi:hypothetical protein DSECCO2_428740 [anaerobic digester metagenome]